MQYSNLKLFTPILIFIAALITVCTMPTASAKKQTLENGPNNGNYAVLTYDDCIYGPWSGVGERQATTNAKTARAGLENYIQTINELVRLRASVVIAPTGMCVEMYKRYFKTDITYYARSHGQYVMSHTYSHRRLSTLTKEQIRWQVRNSHPSYWLRPPHGDVSPKVHKVLKSMNRRAWNWTVSTSDYRGYSQQQVVDSNVQRCRTGDTCLLHLHANGFSPEAIRQTIQGMRANGTKVCGMRINAAGKPAPTAVRWKTLACTK